METGYRGANVGYVTTEEGVIVIDTPQMPSDTTAWRKEIEGKGRVKYLINTESHGDHFIGNFFFAVPVIAHDKTRERILATNLDEIMKRIAVMDPQGASLLANYSVNAPVITFSERLTLYLGKHTFHLMHLPGHTAGQTGVFVPEERVIFTGDNIFYKTQPFLYMAEPFAWLQSLKKISELEVDYIVPGHGDNVCDKGYLGEQASFIHECLDVVKKAIDQGWSKEEAMAKISFFDRYPFLAPGMESRARELQRQNVSRLYDVLSQQ